jgi:peptidoglycan hydrolase-like protein with peptidoglycan-binding domain
VVDPYEKVTPETRLAIQVSLSRLGFYKGPFDCRMTSVSVDAIKAFQQATGGEPDGMPTDAQLSRMHDAAALTTPIKAPEACPGSANTKAGDDKATKAEGAKKAPPAEKPVHDAAADTPKRPARSSKRPAEPKTTQVAEQAPIIGFRVRSAIYATQTAYIQESSNPQGDMIEVHPGDNVPGIGAVKSVTADGRVMGENGYIAK